MLQEFDLVDELAELDSREEAAYGLRIASMQPSTKAIFVLLFCSLN